MPNFKNLFDSTLFRFLGVVVGIPAIWFLYGWFLTTTALFGFIAVGLIYLVLLITLFEIFWSMDSMRDAAELTLLEMTYKWSLLLSVPVGYLRVIVGLFLGWPLTLQMMTLVTVITVAYYVLVRTLVITNKKMVAWNRNYNSWAMVLFSFAWTVVAPMPYLIWGAIPMLIGAALVWEAWLIHKAEKYPEDENEEELLSVEERLEELMAEPDALPVEE